MSSADKNLNEINRTGLPDIRSKKFGIVVSEWNEKITEALYEGAYQTLIENGAKEKNIFRIDVPGSFELSLGAQKLAQKAKIDAVISLGCIIQGETKHFDFIAHAVAQGITNVGLKYDKPIIFGVLTPDTMQQAEDRAGGKHGNKGIEAAMTAIKMLNL